VLKLAALRDRAARHHADVSGAGAGVNTVGEDSRRRSGDVAENTLRLLSMAADGGAHVATQMA
jgi:hypothetical protein